MTDDRLLISFQFLYHLLLQGYHLIYLTTYLIQIVGYLMLLGERRNSKKHICKIFVLDILSFSYSNGK